MSQRSTVKPTYRSVPVATVPKVVGTSVPKSVDDMADALKAKFGADVVKGIEKAHKGDPFVVVESSRILEVMKFLRDDERFYCTSLSVIGAVDYPVVAPVEGAPPAPVSPFKNGHVAVIYTVFSYAHRHQLTLKVFVDRDSPRVASISDIYRAANWYERECYDMTGVEFSNHPNHIRILLPQDWVGYPLRRDYVFPDEYNGMKVPL